MNDPRITGKTAEGIVGTERDFTTGWATRQALRWLDCAEREDNLNALFYAALELRQAIELLWYEHIVIAIGDEMTRRDYKRYKGSSSQLRKWMQTQAPLYTRLAAFTNIVLAANEMSDRVVEWDMPRLIKSHGQLSQYLHFHGMPEETWSSDTWRATFCSDLRDTGEYLWSSLNKASTGLMRLSKMEPEVTQIWEEFRDGKLSAADCEGQLRIAGPVFRQRRMIRGEL